MSGSPLPPAKPVSGTQPRLSPDWLVDPRLSRVLGLLREHGHRALVVGGAVRNAVLGIAPGDIDISTDARPERVQELAEAAGLRQIPTGIDHGTVTVMVDGEPFEVTTFRRDVATDGRRAVVEFSTDVADDARRRDFTMNALYLEADGSVVDPLGGLEDALARRVRFIEDSEQRIREDYLRILRFFRFNAWYGVDFDPEGLAACAHLAEGLDGLSRERVGSELMKLLSAPDPAPSMAAFAATGGLARVLPGADVSALPVLVHLEAGSPQDLPLTPRDPLRRLAAILGAGTDPAAVAAALRLSSRDAKRLEALRDAALAGPGAAETAYRHGAALAAEAELVRAALLAQPLPDGLAALIALGARSKLPLSATDLLPLHQGPALGAALRQAERLWIDSGFTLGRETLLAQVAGK